MITVQLPPSTLVEQERLRHSQNELLRAKQELQWEQLQVQQHEKIARERCISAILAAHKRERVSFEKLCQLSTEVQSDASRWHELLRLISEAYRRSHVFFAGSTLFIFYARCALEFAKGMLPNQTRLISTIAIAVNLQDRQKRSSANGGKGSSAKGGKRTNGLSSCMERARSSHWAP
jgi:hypothetical protein